MRILFLSSWFPYPTDTGGKIRIFMLVRSLAAQHDVTFLAFSRSGDVSLEKVEKLSHLLNCEVLMPIPIHTKGGKWGRNPRWNSTAMRSRIAEQIRRNRFDVLVASEILAGFYGAEVPDIPRILDNCELTVFIERSANEPNLWKRWHNKLDWWRKGRFTRRLALRYDVSTVVSDLERANLARLIAPRQSVISVLQNGVNVGDLSRYRTSSRPNVLIYPGALTFHANMDAMEFFLYSIFPDIRRRKADALLKITGDNRSVNCSHLPIGKDKGVELTGYLDEDRFRRIFAECAVCIVPLRHGGGTRLKILEAMALGVPVVSTKKGAEGLDVTHAQDIIITDDPETFAEMTVRLMDDNLLRQKVVENARRFVNEKYDWGICTRYMADLLGRVGSISIGKR